MVLPDSFGLERLNSATARGGAAGLPGLLLLPAVGGRHDGRPAVRRRRRGVRRGRRRAGRARRGRHRRRAGRARPDRRAGRGRRRRLVAQRAGRHERGRRARPSRRWPRATRRTKRGSAGSTWCRPPGCRPRSCSPGCRAGSANDPDAERAGRARGVRQDQPPTAATASGAAGRRCRHGPRDQPDHPRPRRRERPAGGRASPFGSRTWPAPCSARGHTNDDGRIKNIVDQPVGAGSYRLVFDTASYHESVGTQGFYPEVIISFTVTDPQQHHHVPLLLAPFAYSTYRGS